jgi:hypothetical protein
MWLKLPDATSKSAVAAYRRVTPGEVYFRASRWKCQKRL